MTDPMTVLHDQWVADYVEGRAGASTPLAHLPYPDPTDPVNQGAAAIQALATALDAPTSILGQYRIHNATDSVSIGTGAWSGVKTSNPESWAGTDLAASGNGILVNRAGLYAVDVMIQSAVAGSTTTITVGCAKAGDAGPTGFNRASIFTGGAGISHKATFLVRAAVGDVWQIFVTHNNASNLAFNNRRLGMVRLAN